MESWLPRLWGAVALAVAGWVVAGSFPARTDERAASSIEAVGAEFFSALARELVEDVARDDIQVFRDKKIAIEPFGAFAPLPMDLSAARSLNDRMLKALQETTNGPRRFYSINDLRDLADRIHRHDLGQREFEKELTSLLRRSRVDVVVIGTIRRPDDGFWISYRAVRREDSSRLGATRSHRLPVDPNSLAKPDRGIPLETAIRRAANDFTDNLPPIGKVFSQPLGFEDTGDTGIKTPFGSFVAARFIAALAKRQGETLVEHEMAVETLKIEVRRWPREDPKRLLREAKGAYLLTGAYYVSERTVEISLALRDKNGAGHEWWGRIARDTIDDRYHLHPLAQWLHPWTAEDRQGSLGLRISSDKRGAPAYRIGESLRLDVFVERQAFLYCFVWDEAGDITKLFPSAPHPSARIAGKRRIRLPDDLVPPGYLEGARVRWPAGEPTGRNVFKCFALDEPAEPHLPPGFADLYRGKRPVVPGATPRSTLDVFRRIPRTGLAEASLMVHIER